MTYSPAVLAEQLLTLRTLASDPSRFVVAFSGGVDSTVLLHSLKTVYDEDSRFSDIPLLAIHVDHSLLPASAEWSGNCQKVAEALGVEFRSLQVAVKRDSGKGIEAAAREARYAALQAEMVRGDWLLSAHHSDDQAETLLLNLIRGSGPRGVAGIGATRRFGPGWLVRPLLAVEQAAIAEYADRCRLSWVNDPSNQDRQFDRNFLRHDVLPQMQSRWPDISKRLRRSATHASEASELLIELAAADLSAQGGNSARLPLESMLKMSRPRQRNLIRYALRDCGLTTPTTVQLERILDEVMTARIDAQPLVTWPGGSVRRYRDGLYLLPEALSAALAPQTIAGTAIRLGPGLGTLQLEENAPIGLDPRLLAKGLRIDARKGGEEIRLQGQSHTSKLKNLLQESGVVPWMRDRLPLIYAGEQLVAVADLWLAADAMAEPGIALRWVDRPSLH